MDSDTEPPSPNAYLDDLRRRISALEQRLEGAAAASDGAEPNQAGVQRPDPLGSPEGGSTAPPTTLPARQPVLEPRALPSLTNYLGAAVVKGEAAILEYDLAARTGDNDQTTYWAEQAAGVACLGLSRIVEEHNFAVYDLGDEKENELLASIKGGTQSVNQSAEVTAFREKEIAVLSLIGLSNALSTRLVDDFTGIYVNSNSHHSDNLDARVEKAQRVVCAFHDSLVEARKASVAPLRRRKKLWWSLAALGGGTLAVANVIATPLITPIGAAASAFIAASAADAAVAFLND